ncbi:MAG: hypothetical protein ACHP84_07885 [Caulobacterales bacterium]
MFADAGDALAAIGLAAAPSGWVDPCGIVEAGPAATAGPTLGWDGPVTAKSGVVAAKDCACGEPVGGAPAGGAATDGAPGGVLGIGAPVCVGAADIAEGFEADIAEGIELAIEVWPDNDATVGANAPAVAPGLKAVRPPSPADAVTATDEVKVAAPSAAIRAASAWEKPSTPAGRASATPAEAATWAPEDGKVEAACMECGRGAARRGERACCAKQFDQPKQPSRQPW